MKREEAWKRFTMTGRVEDYLKYRLGDVKEAERGMFRADNDMSEIDYGISSAYEGSRPAQDTMGNASLNEPKG